MTSSDTLLSAFCKAMWKTPDLDYIREVLTAAFKVRKNVFLLFCELTCFKVHQTKYGPRMVPDRQLSKLLSDVLQLPEVFDGSEELHFVEIINSKGLKLAKDIFAQHEALIVALMSLHAPNFYKIFNRNGWSKKKEGRQNRAMAFAPDWIVNIVYDRLVARQILDPIFFKKEFLPYSSVWIDSNTSWIEAGQKRPSEVCGRQGVSYPFCFAGLLTIKKSVHRYIQMQSELQTQLQSTGIWSFSRC